MLIKFSPYIMFFTKYLFCLLDLFFKLLFLKNICFHLLLIFGCGFYYFFSFLLISLSLSFMTKKDKQILFDSKNHIVNCFFLSLCSYSFSIYP